MDLKANSNVCFTRNDEVTFKIYSYFRAGAKQTHLYIVLPYTTVHTEL